MWSHLWTEIERSPHSCSSTFTCRSEDSSNAKVTQFDDFIVDTQKNVLRFDVSERRKVGSIRKTNVADEHHSPVNDALLVDVFQSSANLGEILQDDIFLDESSPPVGYEGVEVSVGAILHHNATRAEVFSCGWMNWDIKEQMSLRRPHPLLLSSKYSMYLTMLSCLREERSRISLSTEWGESCSFGRLRRETLNIDWILM